MKCPNCNNENPDNSNFCGYCGKKIEHILQVQSQVLQNIPDSPIETIHISTSDTMASLEAEFQIYSNNTNINKASDEISQQKIEWDDDNLIAQESHVKLHTTDETVDETNSIPESSQTSLQNPTYNIAPTIERWKQRLLDIGKKNRLINYKETRRSNIAIIKPKLDEIYELLVKREEALEFATLDHNINLYNYDTKNEDDIPNENGYIELHSGQVLTNRADTDMLKTLSSLRAKAKTAMEEQGVNVLYLAFGFLNWKELNESNVILKSPLVLVPVELAIESMTEPFEMKILDDDIVVNPTLLFKLNNDYTLDLPIFEDEDIRISDYLDMIEKKVAPNGWHVTQDIHLSIFSFLKLNMYEDLNNYGERAIMHPIVRAFAGDKSMLPSVPDELNNVYPHDTLTRPIDTYQVVDADSYQQDAVVAAKMGVSFVLQGPPGTGKSQTITNIIAECLASGKKILFVSEKMAALEVVSKRLAETNLIDFCLQLHSHKAKKTDILQELGRMLNFERRQTRDEILEVLDQLLEDRNKLNDYQKELHTTCEPLDKTIFEIHGRLLRYQHAPDITFDFSNVGKCTATDINRFKLLLDEFSRTVVKMGEDYISNPWYGCTRENIPLEFQSDVKVKFTALANSLIRLSEKSKQITEKLRLPQYQNIVVIDKLLSILAHAANSTKPPLDWLTNRDIENLITQAKENRTNAKIYEDTKHNLLSRYQVAVLELPAASLKKQIMVGCSQLCMDIQNGGETTPDFILGKRNHLIKELEDVSSTLADINSLCDQLSEELGIKKPSTLIETKNLRQLTRDILSDPRPAIGWFDTRQFEAIHKFFNKAYAMQIRQTEIENLLKSKFDNEVFEIDAAGMLLSFRMISKSILKIFKRTYYKVKKEFKLHLRNPKEKLSDAIILDYLQQLKEQREISKWFLDNQELLIMQIGAWYNGEFTDWNALTNSMKAFSNVIQFFKDEQITPQVESLLTQAGVALRQIADKADKLDRILIKLENNETLIRITTFSGEIESVPISHIYDKVENILKILVDTTNSYEKIISHGIGESPSFTLLLNDLTDVDHLQTMKLRLAEEETDLKNTYFSYYKGLETDWPAILLSLQWASSLKEMVQIHSLPTGFIELICNDDDAILESEQFRKELKASLDEIRANLAYVEPLFYKGIHEYSQLDIRSLAQWLNTCTDNFLALEEWIDFKHRRQDCINAGLGDFIQNVIKRKLPSASITDAFFKQFYRLWLDVMYLRFPTLTNFRRRNQEALLDDFRLLDKKQFIIARTRIREILSSRLPSQTSINSGSGEIGILRHELGKRRRIMPLRKLFRNIPNLLITLKPCFMMSPLSVSLFLNPECYQFDVIIFDEASQICPEDAIGAIMRGKQIIIAGDSEQLPPTNFFRASLDDSGLDDEEEEDEASGFESILDKASSVLHEKSLRWHYRSKHEHLIAFSNAKIYSKRHDGLITFPSCVNRIPDHGVEYIYVPNGIYERSTTRSNKIEAEQVAKLVFEHFNKYPKRSLGVVTFSESQQDEVEAAVRRMRQNNMGFEEFFSESNNEAFFIKNLENVQGDERDTIIFSIGYAKDQNGIMYMNFGPLSRDGGYRRLNVAITRAKYNVKLVGSIQSTDIDLDRTNSKGVKMLRSYIDFAKIGLDAILNELIIPDKVYLESPFEEEVYKLLLSKNYFVDTQIGCSGYRIDMAIRHSSISGKYVLGIECDGATYHSARTARERDRLREDVLRQRGWKLHRIWSTDWIKDPQTETERLITAIETALNNSDIDDENIIETSMVIEPESISYESPIQIQITETMPKQHSNQTYGLFEYKIFDINRLHLKTQESHKDFLCRSITEVLEIESPIHFEFLCQRLAQLLGREKSTSVVKNDILFLLNNYMKNDVRIVDNFCWNAKKPEIQPRYSSGVDTKRKIEYICKEELAEGMILIINHSYGISPDDLIVETTKEFGFNRTGENIRDAMKVALDYLVNEGRARIVDTKVLL